MRKSWVHLALGALGAFVICGQASAQGSVNFWLNSQGDAAANMPSVINVVSGSNATLSFYLQTSGVGSLAGINMMFGYDQATTTGSGATPTLGYATESSFAWAQSDLTGGQLAATAGGGGGPSDGTTRPYGFFLSSGDLSGTFANTADGNKFHVADITLSILAAPGTDIPVSVWSYNNPTTDNFASAVLDSTGANEYFPSSPYNATLHVVAAPEPASMAILGVGVVALLRRRRR